MRRRAVFLAFGMAVASASAQWQIQTSNTSADLRGIHSVGGGVAWASGTNGTVLRTEDGGYVWQTCSVPPGAEKLDFRGIQAFDANSAIVMSSGPGNQSRLYKTTDGCRTWKLVFTNPEPEGFWDAILMTDKNIGMLIGDPVPRAIAGMPAVGSSKYVFPTYHTIDGGEHWKRNDHNRLSVTSGENGKPRESIFAASNSSMLLLPYVLLFATGGSTNGLHYSQYFFGSPPSACDTSCEFVNQSDSTLAVGETAGAFSITANYGLSAERPESERRLVVVGGDFKQPDVAKGTAAECHPEQRAALTHFQCEAAQTLPHGYRSSVAYDADLKLWITVGPNGTDISTDDGKNWRPVHPGASLHEAPDANRNWNAISLPYVVGPKGRIGRLDPEAIKAALKR